MKFGLAGPLILGILVPLCIIMKMLYHNDLIDSFKSVTVVTKKEKCYGKLCNEELFQWSEWRDSFKDRKILKKIHQKI